MLPPWNEVLALACMRQPHELDSNELEATSWAVPAQSICGTSGQLQAKLSLLWYTE